MKRLSLFLFIAVLLVGTISAQDKDRDSQKDRNNRQDRGERQDRRSRQREAKSVTIDGTLQLEKGFVAVASGDSVYYVPMLTRYIGFIEGLKEGKKVSVEGYEFRKFIHPKKVTIDGKSYDFIADGRGSGGPGFRGDNFGPRRGCGPGRDFGSDRRNGPGCGHRGWV